MNNSGRGEEHFSSVLVDKAQSLWLAFNHHRANKLATIKIFYEFSCYNHQTWNRFFPNLFFKMVLAGCRPQTV
jgi:hypothetical protein